MRRRVVEAPVGHLATVSSDVRPHVVPCCFALVGDVIYSAVDAKPKSTLALRRLANLAAHPAACLLVDHYDVDWAQLWWVRVDGEGRILAEGDERAVAIDHLTAKYAPYVDAPPPGPVVAIDVVGWRAWP
jgi:PPOX class probable F420-dependent enzyme